MLEQLLEKPEAYRRNVALFATFIAGIAVVSVWLLIAGYNIRQSTFALIHKDENETKEFRNSLPSIKQDGDMVVTELSKQNAAASIGAGLETKEGEKSLWDKFLGR
jgi:hypothetical protein